MRASRLAAWLAALLLLMASCSREHQVEGLYDAHAYVTGTVVENQAPNLPRGLLDVLVKVSGDPTVAADPRAVKLAGAAAPLVLAYDYQDRMQGIEVHDEQGTRDRPFVLTMRFDPARIDAALKEIGRTPWGAKRPEVEVIVAMRNGERRRVLAADEPEDSVPADIVESIRQAAWQYGIPVALLTHKDLDGHAIGFDSIAGIDAAGVATISGRLGRSPLLVGTLVWSGSDLGWQTAWHLTADGRQHVWQATGLTYDEVFRRGFAGTLQVLAGHGEP